MTTKNEKVQIVVSLDPSHLKAGARVAIQETNKIGAAYKHLRENQNKLNKTDLARGLLDVRPHRAIKREINQLGAAYQRLKNSGKLTNLELFRAQLQLQRKTTELKRETNGWADSLVSAKTGFASMAAAGYAFFKTFSSFSQFRQRMAEVGTLTDLDAKGFEALNKEVVNLSRNIPQTATDLAAAEYDILSAGVAVEKSTNVLGLSAKAAVAGVTDAKTAVNAGLGVLNAYNLSVSELGSIYDALFMTVKQGVTTFPQLSQYMGEALPTAKAAGVGFREVGAALAALTKAGIRTPQAATALKGMLNSLAAPTEEAQKEFNRLGITWQGMLPTLEQIAAKNLSIDQMRQLIPDVEARTGVLALTQNLESLKSILLSMRNASGAMQDAYNKMKDTPANQIKLFTNEIHALSLAVGSTASEVLLPAAKAARSVMSAFSQTDKVTKYFTASLAMGLLTLGAWPLGLSRMVLGLKGMTLHMMAARAAAGTMTTQILAANVAMKAFGLLAAGYSIYEVGRAVKEFIKMREAIEDANAAQERLLETTEKTKSKFEEFKDVEIPENIASKAKNELKDLQHQLAKAKAYWTALHAELSEKAEETTWLGTLTFDAQKVVPEQQAAAKRLGEINEALKTLQNRHKGVQNAQAKTGTIGKAVYAELTEEAKKSFKKQQEAAEKWATKVISLDEKIRNHRQSTEDKLRALSQQGMGEMERWEDNQALGDEKAAAAEAELKKAQQQYALAMQRQDEANAALAQVQVAAASGDLEALNQARTVAAKATTQAEQATAQTEVHFERAMAFADQAEDAYSRLATAASGKDQYGGQASVTLQEGIDAAKAGVSSIGTLQQQILQAQRAQATGFAATAIQAAGQAKLAFESVSHQTMDVEIKTPNLDNIREQLAELTRDQTKTIHVKTVEAHAFGGMAGIGYRMARGGRLPGADSEEDKIPVLARPGEWFIRNEAVSVWNRVVGKGFMNAVNAPWSSHGQRLLSALKNASLPGWTVDMPDMSGIHSMPLRFATGGMVPGLGSGPHMGTLELAIGGGSFAVQAPVDTLQVLKKAIKRAKRTG